MRLALVAIFALAVGLAGGIWSAWAALDRSFAMPVFRDGPWVGTPNGYRVDANPYVRARRTQRPVIGVDGSESLTLTATRDSAGFPLDPSCSYEISGNRLPTRRWSLTALPDTPPEPMVPPLRVGFTSSEVLRAEDRSYTIRLSPALSPGNWIPTLRPYTLVLNLYDTTLLSGLTQERAALPDVKRLGCEA